MGMFDTILVDKSLIDDLVKDHKFLLVNEKYYSFQTKDLDNALNTFILEKDGTLFIERHEYEVIEEEKRTTLFSPFLREVGEPTKENVDASSYIEFYDFFTTDIERVFVTLQAHIEKGNLVKPISILKMDRTNLKTEEEEQQKHKRLWDIQSSLWQYKLWRFIGGVRNKLHRIFAPLRRKIDDIEYNLFQEARKIAESQINKE